MSLVFNWDKLDDEVALQIETMIHAHFQRISKPAFIGNITASKFRFGSTPPQIEVLDVTNPMEEWYQDMDEEEARLAREAAEAGGGDSIDSEDEEGEYDEEDEEVGEEDDDDDEIRDHHRRHRRQTRQRSTGATTTMTATESVGNPFLDHDEYDLEGDEDLVIVGEGDLVEYLQPDDMSLSRRRRQSRRSSTLGSTSTTTSEGGTGSSGTGYSQKRSTGKRDPGMRISTDRHHQHGQGGDLMDSQGHFKTAITTPTNGSRPPSPIFPSVAAAAASVTASFRGGSISSNRTKPRSASSVSYSQHSSDNEIESEAFYTQGESTIYQSLRNLHLEHPPPPISTMLHSVDEGAVPGHSETTGSTTTSPLPGAIGAGGGSTPSLMTSVFQARNSGTFTLHGGPSSATPGGGGALSSPFQQLYHTQAPSPLTPTTASTSSSTSTLTPHPLSQGLYPGNHHHHHLFFPDITAGGGAGSGNSFLGLGRKPLSSVYGSGAGGVNSRPSTPTATPSRTIPSTPRGFESPILTLSRRQSVSEADEHSHHPRSAQNPQEHRSSSAVGQDDQQHRPLFMSSVEYALSASRNPRLSVQEDSPKQSSLLTLHDSETASTTTTLLGAFLPFTNTHTISTKSRTSSRASSLNGGGGVSSEPLQPQIKVKSQTFADPSSSLKQQQTRGRGTSSGGPSSVNSEPVTLLQKPKAALLASDQANTRKRGGRGTSSTGTAGSVASFGGGGGRGDLEDHGRHNMTTPPLLPPLRPNSSPSALVGHAGHATGSIAAATGSGSSIASASRGNGGLRNRGRGRAPDFGEPITSSRPPSKRHENDIQLLLSVNYQGQMGFTIETELLLNFPTFAFMALPVKLVITGFSFKAKVLMASLRDHVNVCFLEPEDPKESLLSNVRIESQVGDEHKQAMLKNVAKIERFVVEQMSKFLTEDFVYPSYHSVHLQRSPPPPASSTTGTTATGTTLSQASGEPQP